MKTELEIQNHFNRPIIDGKMTFTKDELKDGVRDEWELKKDVTLFLGSDFEHDSHFKVVSVYDGRTFIGVEVIFRKHAFKDRSKNYDSYGNELSIGDKIAVVGKIDTDLHFAEVTGFTTCYIKYKKEGCYSEQKTVQKKVIKI